jgi:hypothetical protein
MKIIDKLFHIYDRYDFSRYDHEPEAGKPFYGVYHIYCDNGWEKMVKEQIDHLRRSGLLRASKKLFVSIITRHEGDEEKLRKMVDSDKLQIISATSEASAYEYPALRWVRHMAQEESCLIYYFHTKGISYQAVGAVDRRFRSFQHKIEEWRIMLEYFIFDKWHIAVNALNDGYDLYGCYQWPPRDYKMFSGNFWWVSSDYARQLPELSAENIGGNRFYSEVWPFQRPHRVCSPFETVVDLYYVRIPRSIYTEERPKWTDRFRFVFTYNWRKFLKHVFHYSYKEQCQKRYQRWKKQQL